ncbi:DUF3943 domain-containing protein [Dysgonomonas sp. 521]|uniref:DUF3943 domain-containing protein n=1 Tax=Dysgonomonas sp. 521 TaxID=2302932 RepID=UPI0013D23375|nr:DUF3943 domain-containing protein [Dysgonomonas sp. 521]NDV97049.1 DUF3943 domain-containing protein [Dysgonomonas sp. 521]
MMNNIAGKQKNRRLFILLFLLAYVLNIRAQYGLDSLDWKIGSDTLRTIPPVMAQSFKIDKALTDNIRNENFKLIPSKVNIYDLPYSMTANYPNYKRLALNSGVLYGAGFLALGVLYALPENATAWNKSETIHTPPFKRWWRNVKKGPVVDKDNFIFNYVLHPYGGAAYYMGARSQGFNILYSALYATGVSTIFWEYGIEAFMEIPSLQDLIITPIAGTLMGEGFYILKRHIVANDYRLFGSPVLGNIVAYLIDPVNEVIGIFAGNPNRSKSRATDTNFAYTPWISASDNGKIFGFTINVSF